MMISWEINNAALFSAMDYWMNREEIEQQLLADSLYINKDEN